MHAVSESRRNGDAATNARRRSRENRFTGMADLLTVRTSPLRLVRRDSAQYRANTYARQGSPAIYAGVLANAGFHHDGANVRLRADGCPCLDGDGHVGELAPLFAGHRVGPG